MHSVDAVAEENGSVIDALPGTGTLVIPADDAYSTAWAQRAGQRRVLRFGVQGADVMATEVQWTLDHWRFVLQTPLGAGPVQLHLAGRHNVLNAAAAAAAACAAGVGLPAITQGLSAFVAVQGRSMMQTLRFGAHSLILINDTYNANPDSVLAAVDVLKECEQPALLVLGDMGEVGHEGPEFHRQVGQYAGQVGIDLYTHGALSVHAQQAHGRAVHHETLEALNEAVCLAATQHRSILVKGSRFMRMERVVSALLQHHKEFEHAA
jgi:UDP-N-acetylmuramoyl-tripeptide--D-alanyl-D-alanine ligase